MRIRPKSINLALILAAFLSLFQASAQAQTSVSISQVQGSGASSPLVGQSVIIEGVVTAIFSGLSGFYIQDPVGDQDPTTSDGVFVYTASSPITVLVGQKIRLTASVTEFNTVTQLTGPSAITVLSSGNVIAPTLVTLPEATEGDLERYEGMLVKITSPMIVAQNYFLGRYGQLTLSANERMFQPTQLAEQGTVQAIDRANQNRRSQLILDDGRTNQNPNPIPYIGLDNTIRAGDTIVDLTGVIDHGLITASSTGPRDYKIHPTIAPTIQRTAPRPQLPPVVGGNVKVASFNVLNYFTTLDQSGAQCLPSNTRSDCRGADSAIEFTRQKAKIISALVAIDADVVGLIEIQRNNNVALQDLVNGLNQVMGAGTYSAVAEPTSGVGTDAIKVALIYKPSRLSLVLGSSLSDTNPIHNRPPVAQGFATPNGERFAVIVNHFKSKGCDGAVTADELDNGEGCFAAKRLAQSNQLALFAETVKTASATQKLLILGDLNAYAQERAITALTNTGYVDLARRFDPLAVSYVFDGAAGTLDYAIASPAMNQAVTNARFWAINADEPFVIDYNTEFKPQDLYTATPWRSSDHDPLLVGLSLFKSLIGTAQRDTLSGTSGDDYFEGGPGADVITTGAGRDVIALKNLRDAGDIVNDFTPGQDQIDLADLVIQAGFPSNPFASGHLQLVQTPNGVAVMTDVDGAAGPTAPRLLVQLRNLRVADLSISRDFIVARTQP